MRISDHTSPLHTALMVLLGIQSSLGLRHCGTNHLLGRVCTDHLFKTMICKFPTLTHLWLICDIHLLKQLLLLHLHHLILGLLLELTLLLHNF